MSKSNTVAVRFLKGWRAYNPGEIAGFEPEVAEQLVKGEAAEYHGKGATPKRSGKAEAKQPDTKQPEGSDDKQPGDPSLDDDARP